MTAAGFASMDMLQFGAAGGEPEITFWRQTIGVPGGGAILHGVFPHVGMPPNPADWCMSDLFIRAEMGPDAGEIFALGCTRLREHDGEHVAHDRPGYPVAAWTTSPSSDTDRSKE